MSVRVLGRLYDSIRAGFRPGASGGIVFDTAYYSYEGRPDVFENGGLKVLLEYAKKNVMSLEAKNNIVVKLSYLRGAAEEAEAGLFRHYYRIVTAFQSGSGSTADGLIEIVTALYNVLVEQAGTISYIVEYAVLEDASVAFHAPSRTGETPVAYIVAEKEVRSLEELQTVFKEMRFDVNDVVRIAGTLVYDVKAPGNVTVADVAKAFESKLAELADTLRREHNVKIAYSYRVAEHSLRSYVIATTGTVKFDVYILLKGDPIPFATLAAYIALALALMVIGYFVFRLLQTTIVMTFLKMVVGDIVTRLTQTVQHTMEERAKLEKELVSQGVDPKIAAEVVDKVIPLTTVEQTQKMLDKFLEELKTIMSQGVASGAGGGDTSQASLFNVTGIFDKLILLTMLAIGGVLAIKLLGLIEKR